MKFIIQHLEVIVAVGGGALAILFIFCKPIKKSNNDLTNYIVKHNRQREVINKRSKTLF